MLIDSICTWYWINKRLNFFGHKKIRNSAPEESSRNYFLTPNSWKTTPTNRRAIFGYNSILCSAVCCLRLKRITPSKNAECWHTLATYVLQLTWHGAALCPRQNAESIMILEWLSEWIWIPSSVRHWHRHRICRKNRRNAQLTYSPFANESVHSMDFSKHKALFAQNVK